MVIRYTSFVQYEEQVMSGWPVECHGAWEHWIIETPFMQEDDLMRSDLHAIPYTGMLKSVMSG